MLKIPHFLRRTQFAHQPHGRPFIRARLDQQIEDFAVMVDGTPEVHAPAGDLQDHLVEVPSVARPRPLLPQGVARSRDRILAPSTHRAMRRGTWGLQQAKKLPHSSFQMRGLIHHVDLTVKDPWASQAFRSEERRVGKEC